MALENELKLDTITIVKTSKNWLMINIFILVFLVAGKFAHGNQIIDNFEGTFTWSGFGEDFISGNLQKTGSIFNSGASSMRLATPTSFFRGFGIGAKKAFNPAINGLNVSSISFYWRSSNNDSIRTIGISLIDSAGKALELKEGLRPNLASALNQFMRLEIPLSLDNFDGPADFNLKQITAFNVILYRNNITTTDTARIIHVDDVTLIEAHDRPLLTTGLIDNFSPATRYNENNLNTLGYVTDDDGTMNPNGIGNNNDRVIEDGVLTLTWDHATDYWYSVLGNSGVNISNYNYLILRIRGSSGNEAMTANFRAGSLFNSSLNLNAGSILPQFTTHNIVLANFVPPISAQNIKSFSLTFPLAATGSIAIDQIALSIQKHPNRIHVTPLTSSTFSVGQSIQLKIELKDETGQALQNFTGPVSISVSNEGTVVPDSASGFNNSSGSITQDFIVASGVGEQSIFVVDDLAHVVATIPIQLLPPSADTITQFQVEFPDAGTNPFWGEIFPIRITAHDINGDLISNPIGNINLTSDRGELITFDDGQQTSVVVMNENPHIVYAYLRGPISTAMESVTITVSLQANPGIIGSHSTHFRNGLGKDDELNFILNHRDDTSKLFFNVMAGEGTIDHTFHIYVNALAIFCFVHRGVLDSYADPAMIAYVRNALTTLRSLQINTGVNAGGFYDVYKSGNGNIPVPVDGLSTPVTSGNNAWLLMALNYYAMFTNDRQFMDVAVALGNFMINRQATSGNNLGGIYSRDTDTSTFVTEHQGEAYSALRFLALMDGVSELEANQYSTKADLIRSFMINQLFNETAGRFEIAAGRIGNTSVDAQLSPFLSLPGPNVSSGNATIAIGQVLDYIFVHLFKTQNYLHPDRLIAGPKFRENDPDTNCHGNGDIDASQKVWIEGAAQLAVALKIMIDSGGGTSSNMDRLNILHENIRKVRDPSGGYPTHLGDQYVCVDLDDVDTLEDDAELVGNDQIALAPTAWSYFSKTLPVLNPYLPKSRLFVTQDSIFHKADGQSEIGIYAVLRRPQAVANQNIMFSIVKGNGSFVDGVDPDGVQTLIRPTDSDGKTGIVFMVTSEPAVAEIKVEILP